MRPGHYVLLLLAALAWLVLGLDGRLHWDEPHYLYTGAHFSIDEIVAGDFQPSLIPGFSTSRIAHVLLGKGVAGLVGIGPLLPLTVMALYALALLVFGLVLYVVLQDLTVPRTWAVVAAVVVMFSPIGLYLVGKTLPDTPALMWSALAVLAAIRLLHGKSVWLWLPIGILALALTALSKHVLVWTFVAFGAAALVSPPGTTRTKVLAILAALSAGSLVLFGALLTTVGIDPADFL